jgi:hypothetical protein
VTAAIDSGEVVNRVGTSSLRKPIMRRLMATAKTSLPRHMCNRLAKGPAAIGIVLKAPSALMRDREDELLRKGLQNGPRLDDPIRTNVTTLYELGRSIDARLTVAAVKAVIAERQPLPGCVQHSDRES